MVALPKGGHVVLVVAGVRADLPILSRSTLSNLAAKEDAVDETKQKIDRILARLNYPYAK